MDAKILCSALMRADSEDEVVSLLNDAGLWNDESAWRFLGDNENNFAQIGGQQAEAVAALNEKIVNSVDARLTNACWEAGIDPASPSAPASIREAVAVFFEGRPRIDSEKAGRIAHWEDAKTTAEGRLLTVAATGRPPKKGRPCISIADQGEGQTPDSFPNTFMSLGRSNKLRVQFVQGKYNMGGTGALQFCSAHHRLQLIVSRRNPRLLGKSKSQRDDQWGFTVVRREAPSGGVRSSVFTYLAPVGADEKRKGGVLAFEADEWPIFPEADAKVRDAYHRMSPFGSLVKLYEYEWQGTKSNIVQSGGGLMRRIDLGLIEAALPVRVFECRNDYSGHAGSFATNITGLAARLERDKAASLEPGFPIGTVIDVDGKKVRARAFAFKKETKTEEYRTRRHGIVFSVNGQSHGALATDFFRRKSVGMSYLSDSLLVTVDCTGIDGAMREDLFMTTRDRIRECDLSQRLERELESFLKEDPSLRLLRNRRREEDLADKLADSKPLASALEDLIRRSPSLARLFLQGIKVSSPFPPVGGTGQGAGGEFKGKTYPTYFRFKGLPDGARLTREAHLESRTRVAFETDAADDYFLRDLDPAAATVKLVTDSGETDVQNWVIRGPVSGIASLSLTLPAAASVGDRLEFVVAVTDASRVEPFSNHVALEVKAKANPGTGGTGTRSKSTNTGKGSSGTSNRLALPNIVEVHEPEWPSYPGFDEKTALIIKHAGDTEDAADVYDFYVNVDNISLRTAEKEWKEDPKLLKARFVYSQVLIGLALIQDERRPADDDGDGDSARPSIEEVVASTTKAVAPFILPLVDMIAGLTIDESGFGDN